MTGLYILHDTRYIERGAGGWDFLCISGDDLDIFGPTHLNETKKMMLIAS